MGVIAKKSKACPTLCWNCGQKAEPNRLHIVTESRTEKPNRYGSCMVTIYNWEEGTGRVLFQ